MVGIAQLIKLKDYISRYEWNVYQYASRYIRLKKEHWRDLYDFWEYQRSDTEDLFVKEEISSIPFLHKSIIKNKIKDITTETELRQFFLDELFPLQLKWATSTVTNLSFYDEKYTKDPTLKYFLQRFPDIYLLMYDPVFHVKNTVMDGEIILISPFQIEIIHCLKSSRENTYIAEDHRKWYIDTPAERKTMISPLVALNRTKHIVESILSKENIHLPITKVVLAKENQILYSVEPYATKFIGSSEYDEWFQNKRRIQSTLKNMQLKAAELLLNHCSSVYVKRPEWVTDEDHAAYERED